MTDKTKMIYNDDKSIGIDEKSLNKFDLLFNHNNETDQFLKDHIQIINYDN